MKKKATIAVTALLLVLCFAIGGTLAWLKAETKPVVNTFTYGDINIDLSESENLNLKMIPGNDIKKDPTVTVKANSEDCWLFVRVKASDNFDTFMTYAIADGWTALDANTGVYYREVTASDKDQEFNVLKDNTVTVKNTVTKQMLNALDKNEDGSDKTENEKTYPTLTFTAYAVQKDNVNSAADAWVIAQGNN